MKSIKNLSLLVALIFFSNVCLASDGDDAPGGLEGTPYMYEGLWYLLNDDTHEATVSNGDNWNGELNIPSKIDCGGEEYTVTYIAWLAFDRCETLTKVFIPKTVKDIRHYAQWEACKNPFTGCVNLTSIEVDEDNPWMCSEDGVLFNKEKTFLYCYPAGSPRTSYSIPNGIQKIGMDAFAYSSHLDKVVIPSSVTTMYGGVFAGCKNLEEVHLPAIEVICASMFRDCEKLKSIDIPSSVHVIEEQVFWGCASLKVIDIPSSVEHIGSLVFGECNLDAIVIRGTIQYLTKYIFASMNNSAIIYVPASQIDKYKDIYMGTVLTVEAYNPTYIRSINTVFDKTYTLYDLSGRRLNAEPQHGVYIKDGKKVVIK